jgi:hypothetical protein
MLSCSSEGGYKSKAKEKVSGLPHMVLLEFLLAKRVRNFKAEIDAVSV